MSTDPHEAARHYLHAGDHAREELGTLLDLIELGSYPSEAEYFRTSARTAWYLLKLLTYTVPEDVVDAVHEYRANGITP